MNASPRLLTLLPVGTAGCSGLPVGGSGTPDTATPTAYYLTDGDGVRIVVDVER